MMFFTLAFRCTDDVALNKCPTESDYRHSNLFHNLLYINIYQNLPALHMA